MRTRPSHGGWELHRSDLLEGSAWPRPSRETPRPYLLVLAAGIVLAGIVAGVVAASTPTSLTHTFPPGWSLVSVPMEPDDPSPHATFSELPGPLYLHTYADNRYIHADDAGFTAVTPGRSYWLLLEEESTATFRGELVSTDEPVALAISPGQNPIATPWLDGLGWQDDRVSVHDGESLLPLSEAIDQGWVDAELQGYDPDGGEYVRLTANAEPAEALDPWEGFLLRSHIDGTVVLEPPAVDDAPPTVDISSPEEDAELTGAVPIVGTADHDDLVQYTLEYSVGDTEEYIQIASGDEPVVDGELGALDTTLVPNGIIRLRLTALSLGGERAVATQNVLAVGQNKPGNFSITYTDLEVPVSGIPITLQRTYDSRERAISRDFGHGWDLEVVASGDYTNNRKPGDGWIFTDSFFPCDGGATATKSHITEVRFSDTEFYRFRLRVDFAGAISGGCQGVARFEWIGGVPGAELAILDTTNVFWGRATDHVTYEPGHPRYPQIYEPPAVRLTTIDGREFDVSLAAGITRIGDPNGNDLFLSASGVSHSSGLGISFSRDSEGRITEVTDPAGNNLTYDYDGDGDLVGVTDRNGATTTFAYEPGHFLVDIVDPLGDSPLRNEYDEDGRLVAHLDPDGNRTRIDTDVDAGAATVTNRLGDQADLAFDDNGLVSEATVAGATMTLTYDDRGNPLTETDALGHTRSFAYDDNDLLTSETDALGNTTSYAYTDDGRLGGITDADGNTTSFTYDARGNVLRTEDDSGTTLQEYAYDGDGNVTSLSTPEGTTTFAYDGFGNLTRRQGPEGSDVSFTHDANGRVLSETVRRTVDGQTVEETTTYAYAANGNLLSVTDPLGAASTFTYDAVGNLLTETDPRGNTTTHRYDAHGNRVRTTYADGTFEAFGYDPENRLVAETDQAGRTTFHTYDVRGRPISTTYPDGTSVAHAYDAAGRLVSVEDEIGHLTTFAYDGAGRRTSQTDPLGNTTQFAYSSTGARTSVTDPLDNVTQFAYDEGAFGAQRPTTTTHPDGEQRHRTYTSSGNLGSVTDESGSVTAFGYDDAGNLARVADGLGGETTYAYDEAGNRTAQTDAEGNTTTFTYDANGRLVERTLPEGMSETFTYDDAGNGVSHTDFNGETTTFTYDVMNRVTLESLPDGQQITYTYTPTGETATVTDTRGTTTYTYDARDRLTEIEEPDGTTVSYVYDDAGRRASMTTPAGSTTYGYDDAGRLVEVTGPDGGMTTLGYDAAGNRTLVILPNGTEVRYAYDLRGRLTGVEHLDPDGGPIAGFDYSLDGVGNVLEVEEPDGRTVMYSYDDLHRLVSEDVSTADGTAVTTYTYDGVGNRLSLDRDGATTVYTYDDNGRLLTADGASFTYDANGNLLTHATATGGVTEYAFDPRGRLVGATTPDGAEATFGYDARGNRVSSDVDGSLTRYVVDPLDLSGVPQVAAELDDTGSVSAGYVRGADLLAVDRGGDTHAYHSDGIGSIRALSDAAGEVSDTYAYDAFGNLVDSSGTTPNVFRFHGEQLEPSVDLYHLRARHLSPELGRFISADPFPGVPHAPATLHRYTFAHNNPVIHTDPTGLFSLGSVSVSISIQSSLASMALQGFGIHGQMQGVEEFLDEWLLQLPEERLNEDKTVEQLGQIGVSLDAGFGLSGGEGKASAQIKLALSLDNALGEGAVGTAFGMSGALSGGLAANVTNFHFANLAALWLQGLPQVDGIPGGYRSCEFNRHVHRVGYLGLINHGSSFMPSHVQRGLQVMGAWLGYLNYQALMLSTVQDVATSTPSAQPPTGRCPMPGSW